MAQLLNGVMAQFIQGDFGALAVWLIWDTFIS